MVRPAGYLLAVLALVSWAGCMAKEATPAPDAAARHKDAAAMRDGTHPGDVAAFVDDDAAVGDAPPTPTNCQTLRSCIYACRADTACAAHCLATAPAAARQQYDQANACSTQACPNRDDIDCRCMAECLGGECTQIVDECDDAASDPFCDMQCH
jgi:hypothetical protein